MPTNFGTHSIISQKSDHSAWLILSLSDGLFPTESHSQQCIRYIARHSSTIESFFFLQTNFVFLFPSYTSLVTYRTKRRLKIHYISLHILYSKIQVKDKENENGIVCGKERVSIACYNCLFFMRWKKAHRINDIPQFVLKKLFVYFILNSPKKIPFVWKFIFEFPCRSRCRWDCN